MAWLIRCGLPGVKLMWRRHWVEERSAFVAETCSRTGLRVSLRKVEVPVPPLGNRARHVHLLSGAPSSAGDFPPANPLPMTPTAEECSMAPGTPVLGPPYYDTRSTSRTTFRFSTAHPKPSPNPNPPSP